MSILLENIGESIEICDYEVDPPYLFKIEVGQRFKTNDGTTLYSNLYGTVSAITTQCEETTIFATLETPAKNSIERNRIDRLLSIGAASDVNNNCLLKIILGDVELHPSGIQPIEKVVIDGVTCRRPIYYY